LLFASKQFKRSGFQKSSRWNRRIFSGAENTASVRRIFSPGRHPGRAAQNLRSSNAGSSTNCAGGVFIVEEWGFFALARSLLKLMRSERAAYV
jgi:hypothetical protein